MAYQDFDLAGVLKVRPAEEGDAAHLHTYCFPEKNKTQVTKELQADLAADSQTHRLVAESSGHSIGQITVSKTVSAPETAHVGNLVVSAPFRQLGVADHLIKAAEATAAEVGVKTLEIELPASETNVIDRYKDWGFVEKPSVTLQKALGTEEQAAAEEAEDPAADTSGEQQELLNT